MDGKDLGYDLERWVKENMPERFQPLWFGNAVPMTVTVAEATPEADDDEIMLWKDWRPDDTDLPDLTQEVTCQNGLGGWRNIETEAIVRFSACDDPGEVRLSYQCEEGHRRTFVYCFRHGQANLEAVLAGGHGHAGPDDACGAKDHLAGFTNL
jgi:hypothetical protein